MSENIIQPRYITTSGGDCGVNFYSDLREKYGPEKVPEIKIAMTLPPRKPSKKQYNKIIRFLIALYKWLSGQIGK
jgi:hypothetical protein